MPGLFASDDIAIAVGGDKVWFASGPDGPPVAYPAFVATGRRGVIAAGEDAVRMRGKEPENIRVNRVTRHGGFADASYAEPFLRYLIRKHSRPSLFRMQPRAVVACMSEAKLGVKDTAVHAGIRELLTIDPVMAAAIGAGLDVEKPEFIPVFILERDWCSFGVISLAGVVAAFDLRGGVDLLLEDFALHALATRSVALEPESLHAAFLAHGLSGADLVGWDAWIGELETGRAAVTAASEFDFRRGSLPFALRLGWHYRQALEPMDKAKRLGVSANALHFFGPYTKTAGVADLIARAFQASVVIHERPEEAAIRGVQKIIADLGHLLRAFRPASR